MDNLIKFEKNSLISVISRIFFIASTITAYYDKSQMSHNKPKMPIPGQN
jgi:hypothetical protein